MQYSFKDHTIIQTGMISPNCEGIKRIKPQRQNCYQQDVHALISRFEQITFRAKINIGVLVKGENPVRNILIFSLK